jgi:hypothetical protein
VQQFRARIFRASKAERGVTLFAVSLAAVVAVFVGGVPPAFAAGCSAGVRYEGGYATGTHTAVGHALFGYIDLRSDTVVTPGNVRGFLEVEETNGETSFHSLTVGVRDTGGGPKVYYEYDGVTEDTFPISFGHSVHVWISHTDTNDYTVHWEGTSTTFTAKVQGDAGFPDTLEGYFASAKNDNGPTCEAMDFSFYGLSPYTTSEMGGSNNTYTAPYALSGITDTSFVFSGP